MNDDFRLYIAAEKMMQDRIAFDFDRRKIHYFREYYFGDKNDRIVADFVVGGWALECKFDLGRNAMLKAIGQCAAYVAVGMAEHAAIVTRQGETALGVVWHAAHRAGFPIISELQLPEFLENPEPFICDGFNDLKNGGCGMRYIDASFPKQKAAREERERILAQKGAE